MGNRVANKPLIAYTHPRFFRHPAQALCKTSGSGHLRHPSRRQILQKEVNAFLTRYNPLLDRRQRALARETVLKILSAFFNRQENRWSKGHRKLSEETGLDRKIIGKWLRALERHGLVKMEADYYWNGDDDKQARAYSLRHDLWLKLLFCPIPRGRKKSNDTPTISFPRSNTSKTYGFGDNKVLLSMQNASDRLPETKTENQKGKNRGLEKIYSMFLKYPWLKDDPRYERFWGLMSRGRRQVIYNRLWYLRRSLKATKITKSTPLDRLPKAQKHWLLKNASLILSEPAKKWIPSKQLPKQIFPLPQETILAAAITCFQKRGSLKESLASGGLKRAIVHNGLSDTIDWLKAHRPGNEAETVRDIQTTCVRLLYEDWQSVKARAKEKSRCQQFIAEIEAKRGGPSHTTLLPLVQSLTDR